MIEEIIAYSAEHDDHDVALLTNDTNPMLTAREHCLNCYEIPETWLLAPESDEKEKEILKLKTLLAEASKKLPQIEIRVLGAAMEALPQIRIRMVQYSRLEESRIAGLQLKPQELRPMSKRKTDDVYRMQDFGAIAIASMMNRRSTPERRLSSYQAQYKKWADGMKQFFVHLPERLESKANRLNAIVEVKNLGVCQAERTRLDICLQGGLLLEAPAKKDEPVTVDQIRIPQPPVYYPYETSGDVMPHALLERDPFMNDRLLSLISARQQDLDPHAFYWDRRPEGPESAWRFTCEEFRHHAEPKVTNLAMFFQPD